MNNYDTVTEAVNDLQKRGYTENFIRKGGSECLICFKSSLHLPPEFFKIDEVHRFEGDTDPADSAIVYAISSEKLSVKGIVVNAFGVYGDSDTHKIVQNLNIYAS